MKLKSFIIALIFIPEPVYAQDMLLHEIVPVTTNEQTYAFEPQYGNDIRIMNATPSEKSIIEVNAIVTRKNPAASQDLSLETGKTDPLDAGIINDWFERVSKSVSMQYIQRESDLANEGRLHSNNELNEQLMASRMVLKILLKETLRFTQERFPKIDMLVRTLKFEISTDTVLSNVVAAEAHTAKTGETPVSRHPLVNDGLFFKTGLRFPVEGGRLNLISETEARYGNVSSFFSVYLDNHFNNAVGLVYEFNNDIQLRVERQTTQAMNSIASDRSNDKFSFNLILLVCNY